MMSLKLGTQMKFMTTEIGLPPRKQKEQMRTV